MEGKQGQRDRQREIDRQIDREREREREKREERDAIEVNEEVMLEADDKSQCKLMVKLREPSLKEIKGCHPQKKKLHIQ